jgi:hypothetical protein
MTYPGRFRDQPSIFEATHSFLTPSPISSHFSISPIVTTCFYAFTSSVNHLQVPERIPKCPHAFLRLSGHFRPISAYFYLFLIIFIHFRSFLPVPFATFELYYIPTLTPNLSRYPPPIFESCHPFFDSFSSIFIILDHFHLF